MRSELVEIEAIRRSRASTSIMQGMVSHAKQSTTPSDSKEAKHSILGRCHSIKSATDVRSLYSGLYSDPSANAAPKHPMLAQTRGRSLFSRLPER
mmetsp:Transcript_8074/g.9142  ORF Transcript_8074/g.9142 Transcript_8074/m.9142 type:complete len:95 (+) Transcript_8074:170-454(+)